MVATLGVTLWPWARSLQGGSPKGMAHLAASSMQGVSTTVSRAGWPEADNTPGIRPWWVALHTAIASKWIGVLTALVLKGVPLHCDQPREDRSAS